MGPVRHSSNHSSGCIPDYGAIFLANNTTREECLTRKLFGLPTAHADFVMKVKRGMMLFLYDYQAKKLYGVFEAATDGEMNIVPHAYQSAYAKFPAQVRFSVLWRCAPLPGHAFRDAIKENFYGPNKFNFGLSRDQVRRLLFLFDDLKLEIPRSPMTKVQPDRQKKMVSSVGESSPLTEHNKNHPVKNRTQACLGKVQNVCHVVSSPNSMPKKLASLVVCDREMSADVEDYIPLPSIDSDEIEDGIPDTFQLETNPSTFQPCSEPSGSLLKLALCVPGSESIDIDVPIDDSIRYQVQGFESGSSKPAAFNSEYERGLGRGNDEKIDGRSACRVPRLYSEGREKSLSVFHRLSGLPKEMAEKSSDSNWWKGLLDSLDEKHKLWHSADSCTAHGNAGPEDQISRAAETVQRDRVPVSAIKHLDKADSFTRHDSKRKGTDTIEGKQQKRSRLSGNCSGKSLLETTCNKLPLVPEPSQGSSVGAVNSGSNKAPPKSQATSGTSDSVNLEKAHCTQPYKSEDDVEKPEDPVEKLLNQFHEYLCRSYRMNEQAETISVHQDNNDDLKSSTDGEGSAEFHNLRDGAGADVSVTN